MRNGGGDVNVKDVVALQELGINSEKTKKRTCGFIRSKQVRFLR